MHRATLFTLLVAAVLLLAGCDRAPEPSTQPDASEPSGAAETRPNILLIVADDMGYTDLGSFGGEIETPNLDELALAGVRLTNFQTASMCSPSRAMMLTGVDAHKAGYGNMLEELSPNQKGQPGYEGYLNDNVVTIATLLRDAGYSTFLSGKWHLGSEPQSYPGKRGFERSFVLNSGGGSHFADMKPAYAPNPDTKADYMRDDVKLTELPPSFTYSSQYFADQLISYLDERDNEQQPFFALLAFTAPHWPLQAPDAALEKYAGRYDQGYDEVLTQRLSRMAELGLLADNAVAVSRPPKGLSWSALTAEEQRVEAKAMEVYAAMIDEMDVHTGRVIDYLRQSGELDNTVVVFLSDNGAEGHDLDETWPADMFPKIRAVIDQSFDFSFEQMGKPGSYLLYGPNWARVGSPTGRLHKAFPTEGGTRTSAFVHYPRVIDGGRISDELVAIKDVAPTLLELAGVSPPNGEYRGRPVEPMTGVSFTPLLADPAERMPERPLGMELMGKRALRLGDWKLVHMPPPFGSGEWQLFDLASDPAESEDLAAREPGKVAELQRHWNTYAEENAVIIPDWVSGY
ncbi:MAG: arylsulfatase [Pseudomonadota bacterium]